MSQDDGSRITILTDLSQLRARWLADLTRAVESHMRSEPFLEWMRYSVMAMTEAQSVVARGYFSLFFRVR